jgi:hypothetical protein
MELIEIKGLFEIDYGAPSPTILSNDTKLYIAFYADRTDNSTVLHERNEVYDTGIVALKFNRYINYRFGMPGNETIHGHPYSKLGMSSCSFYELKDSDYIKSLQDIDKVHRRYDAEEWRQYHHYILTFHDNMFECVAHNFEIREENTSLHSQVTTMVNELSSKKF